MNSFILFSDRLTVSCNPLLVFSSSILNFYSSIRATRPSFEVGYVTLCPDTKVIRPILQIRFFIKNTFVIDIFATNTNYNASFLITIASNIDYKLLAWLGKGLMASKKFEGRAEGKDLIKRDKEPFPTCFSSIIFWLRTVNKGWIFDFEVRSWKKIYRKELWKKTVRLQLLSHTLTFSHTHPHTHSLNCLCKFLIHKSDFISKNIVWSHSNDFISIENFQTNKINKKFWRVYLTLIYTVPND